MASSYTLCMNGDNRDYYRALMVRDPRFDGRFFTGVRTTGIYCRPICPAKTPAQKNCQFFESATAAERAGFRPCLRCRPESAPGSPAWQGTVSTVSRSLRLIGEGALVEEQMEVFANRLGMGARQLRRLFQQHLGVSPLQIEKTRRCHLGKKLLDETSLPVTQVAAAAGFSSLRRFQDAMQQGYGRSARELRRSRASFQREADITLHLRYRPPFDWSFMLGFWLLAVFPVLNASLRTHTSGSWWVLHFPM